MIIPSPLSEALCLLIIVDPNHLQHSMSSSKLYPSVALLRSLRLAAHPSNSTCLRACRNPSRALHRSASLFEEQRSFKGQLYDSVGQRLERERAEQRRFAKERGESSGGRTAATTFGTTLSHHLDTLLSLHSLRHYSIDLLLFRLTESDCPALYVHYPFVNRSSSSA